MTTRLVRFTMCGVDGETLPYVQEAVFVNPRYVVAISPHVSKAYDGSMTYIALSRGGGVHVFGDAVTVADRLRGC